jgi:hypothetical protein
MLRKDLISLDREDLINLDKVIKSLITFLEDFQEISDLIYHMKSFQNRIHQDIEHIQEVKEEE